MIRSFIFVLVPAIAALVLALVMSTALALWLPMFSLVMGDSPCAAAASLYAEGRWFPPFQLAELLRAKKCG